MSDPSRLVQDLVSALDRVVLGQRPAIETIVTAFAAGGHVLIEDRPGVGKTLLARALAHALGLPFQRVQCTADMLPADVLGGLVYVPGQGAPELRRGPVFTSILLADELNRTPPRTQSALLECMAEGRVSIDRETIALPDPFFVIATQNPAPHAGTYPLPESQLDRFLVRVHLGYPDAEIEAQIVQREDGHGALAAAPVLGDPDTVRSAITALRARIDDVRLQRDLLEWIVTLARASRQHPEIELGVSPRGAQALHRACRARALVAGRDHVIPDDVVTLARSVFAHRLVPANGDTSIAATEALVDDLLQQVAAPVEV
jgi:MoxR-like ATPase